MPQPTNNAGPMDEALVERVALLPCPLCGDHDDFNPSVSSSYGYVEPGNAETGTTGNPTAGLKETGRYVECDKCGCCGPNHPAADEAIAAWNTRAAMTQPKQAAVDEPTEAMIEAGRVTLCRTTGSRLTSRAIARLYLAMRAATTSQQPPASDEMLEAAPDYIRRRLRDGQTINAYERIDGRWMVGVGPVTNARRIANCETQEEGEFVAACIRATLTKEPRDGR